MGKSSTTSGFDESRIPAKPAKIFKIHQSVKLPVKTVPPEVG